MWLPICIDLVELLIGMDRYDFISITTEEPELHSFNYAIGYYKAVTESLPWVRYIYAVAPLKFGNE